MDEISKQLEQKLETYGKEVRGVSLSVSEKNAMREKLDAFVREHPVREALSARLSLREGQKKTFFTRSFRIKIRMMIALILAVLLGSGVSYAAEGALPGDILYPIKTEVTEGVRSLVAVSAESEAKLQAEFAERRLEEAEQLASEGRLDAKTQGELSIKFKEHAEKSEKNTGKIESENSTAIAAEIHSDFESALQAHEQVLAGLQIEKAEVQVQVDSVLNSIRTEISSSSEARISAEVKIAEKDGKMAEEAALGAKKSAANKIAEVKKFFEGKKEGLSAEGQTDVSARIAAADKIFAEGEAKLAAEAHPDAFALFKKASREVQRTKYLIEASKEFDLNIVVNGMEVRLDARGKSETKMEDGTRVKVEDDGSVKIEKEDDNESDGTKGKTKIEIHTGEDGGVRVETNSSASGSGSVNVNTTQKIQVNTGGQVQVGI